MSQGETLGSFSLHCLQISQGKRKKKIYFSWLQCIAYGNIYGLELAQVLSPPRHGAVRGRHPVKFNHVWFPWPLEQIKSVRIFVPRGAVSSTAGEICFLADTVRFWGVVQPRAQLSLDTHQDLQ